MAARVVDLPLPVGPVTSINPLGFKTSSFKIWGNPSSSIDGIISGTSRKTKPIVPLCCITLTRNRARPGTL